MVNSNDGFRIAEADLKLRGPGDIYGTRQSGILDLKIADIAEDDKIVKAARDDAFEIIESDPQLTKAENKSMRDHLLKMKNSQNLWGSIS